MNSRTNGTIFSRQAFHNSKQVNQQPLIKKTVGQNTSLFIEMQEQLVASIHHKDNVIQRYEQYKLSGVEWLGEIPTHWELRRIKFLFEEKNERSKTGDGELLSLSKYHGIIPRTVITEKVESANTLIGYKICSKGDLVINKLQAWNGMLDISQYTGLVSPDYSVYIKRNNNLINKTYFKYLFTTSHYIAEFSKNSSGIGDGFFRLYTDAFYNIQAILPPLAEQIHIARFLDCKTAQIDQAITQKQRLIELLKERRQILINNAVTRGLNPNAPMKDSGVEWIGEIPAHWEMKKIKYQFKLIGGGTPNRENKNYWDGNIPWVSPKDMNTDYIFSTEDNITEEGLKNSATALIECDTLLMVVRSGILQRTIPVAISKRSLSINQDMKAFIPIREVSTNYLFHFIQGNDLFLRNVWVKQGATVESVEMDLLKNGLIPVPPKEEQIAISEYIEKANFKITNAITYEEKEIEKLKEYKATLINSAVTGEIKVSDANIDKESAKYPTFLKGPGCNRID